MKDMDRLPAPAKAAPETWEPARRMAERVIRPIEQFLHIQAASGLLLLGAAVIALVWANSRFSHSYEALWHLPVTLGVGGLESRQTLHFWINEGLMTIFFFVVGLEIKREIHEGELSNLRRAALPVAAALGGMLVPALIYFLLNPRGPSRQGWGVPMATDIAFAVGILALLGKRVPAALRVLLLALAIIDDIGAIIVIAVFYSSGFSWLGILLAVAGVAGVIALQRLGVRNALVYVAPGAVIWLGMLKAGIHPTIAGVVLGLLTPARTWFGPEGFLAVANDALEDFKGATEQPDPHEAAKPLDRMRRAQREALAPAVRLQIALHPWVAYLIMPIFALANAGVVLGSNPFASDSGVHVLGGVVLGLVLGKPIGIVLASFIAVKARLCSLPTGVTWRGVTVVGCVAGIGFTMAIFIAGLAFDSPEMLGTAKLGVLVASGAAALVGLTVGALALPKEPIAGAAATVDEAESLTDK